MSKIRSPEWNTDLQKAVKETSDAMISTARVFDDFAGETARARTALKEFHRCHTASQRQADALARLKRQKATRGGRRNCTRIL